MQMEDNGYFIKSLFRRHAALNVLSLLTSTIGPVVCNVLAGLWYGSEGLAIAALCAPLFFLAGFFGFVISGGASVLAAKAIARDELDEVDRIYSAAVVLSMLTGGITFGGLLLFRREVIALLAGDAALDAANYYVCIVLYAFVTVIVYIPLYFSRVTGRNKVGVLLTAVMTAVTLVAVPVLKPLAGLASIALGQAVGTAVAAALCMFLLRKSVRIVFPRKLYIRQIAADGSPMGLSRLYSFIGTFVLNILFIRAGGSEALAVYGVVASLNRFVTSVTIGASQTVVPLASVFHEERDITSSKQLMKTAFISINAVLAAICALLSLLRGPISAAFGLDASTLTVPLALNSAYLMLNLNASLFTAYYNASGRLLLANAIPLLQDFALLLPLSWALGFSVHGIWTALPLASLGALLFLAAAALVLKMKDKSLSFPLLADAKGLGQGSYISFSVESDPSKASEAAGKIAGFCEEQELSPRQTMLISMAIEEMLTLIIRRIGQSGDFSISVRLFLTEGSTILRIRNGGPPFDPIAYYKDNISDDPEKSLDIIGMKYVVETAEVVYYRQTFGVNNLVVIL